MSLELPDLSQKKFDDIMNGLIAAVPQYAQNWTNLNPSDPGVTLLELLAWVGETTLYKANRISLDTYVYFLRLVTGIKGPREVNAALEADSDLRKSMDKYHEKIVEFQYGIEQKFSSGELTYEDIPVIKKQIMEFNQSRYRAVTQTDFEELALEATQNEPAGSPGKAARVIVEESFEKKGKILIRLVADSRFSYTFPLNSEFSGFKFGSSWKMTRNSQNFDFSGMLNAVFKHLEPRKLIGSPIETSLVKFTPFSMTARVYFVSITRASSGVLDIMERIRKILDPVEGGEDDKGWPYQRSVSIYEISQVMENVAGVDHVDSLEIFEMTEVDGKIIEKNVNSLSVSGLPRLEAFTIIAEGVAYDI